MKRTLAYLFLACLAIACAKPEEPDPQPGPGPEPVPGPVVVESVAFQPETFGLVEGDSLRVQVIILPEDAEDKSYTLSSSNVSVATIDSTGMVRALSPGTAVMTAVAGDLIANCPVKVEKDRTIYIRTLTVNEVEVVMRPGETKALSYTVSPEFVTEKIKWSSDDENVVTVNESGEVTAVAEGSTAIRALTKKSPVTIPVKVVAGSYYIARVDALTRVLNNQDYIDSEEPVRVARGETAAIQMCLTPYVDVSSISASVKLPDASLTPRLFWEREITCSRHWDTWAGGPADDEVYTNGDKYLDPLMPMDVWNPAPVAPNTHIVLWCEFDVPRGYAPGTYEAEVTFDIDGGGALVSKKFDVQVYAATLPEDQGLTVINWECGDFRAMNGGEDISMDTWEPLMSVLVEFMNGYGQNAWRTFYGNKHYMGDRAVADYSTDPPTIRYDFETLWSREFEMYAAKCRGLHQVHGMQCASKINNPKMGQQEDLAITAHFFDPANVDESGRPKLVYESGNVMDNDERTLAIKAGFTEYFRQLGEFLKSHRLPDGRTWLDIYAQTIHDEPMDHLVGSYEEVARLIKDGCPEMKITEAVQTDLIDPKYLDYPCPTLKAVGRYNADPSQTLWMYTCMSPQGNYANRFIRIPTIKTRIVHWCNYYYNAPAYLHWGLKYWQGAKNGDAYGDALGQFIGGDNFIIYPDYRRVYPSIRLCAMRDGIRDYDLLKLIESKSASKAQEFLGRVVRGAADYDTDVRDFRETRREMLEYLSE